jgi:hypothetical protein
VVNAYLIALGGLLLLAGRIGDLIRTAAAWKRYGYHHRVWRARRLDD